MKTTIDFFPLLKWFKVKDCCFVMRNLISFLLICVSMSVLAHPKCESAFNGLPNDTIYGGYQVDKNPEYPGGLAECVGFINKNIDREKCEGEEGRVILNFVVNSDGSLSDIKVLRGVSRKVDKEIVSIVEKMPKWNPGTLNGNPVRVRFTLPVMVKFGVNNTDEPKEYLPADRSKIGRISVRNTVIDRNWPKDEVVRFLISYIVDEYGSIKNVAVREGVPSGLAEQEAIYEVRNLGMLSPTMKDGKPVASERLVYVYVPIRRKSFDEIMRQLDGLEKILRGY